MCLGWENKIFESTDKNKLDICATYNVIGDIKKRFAPPEEVGTTSFCRWRILCWSYTCCEVR